MFCSTHKTPIGALNLFSNGKSLNGLSEKMLFKDIELKDDLEIFNEVKNWLDDYFLTKKPKINFSIEPIGTNFQKEVWDILLNIPYGKTTTYGQIAKIIASKRNIEKMSNQAVGQAIGKNPILIIIPCHRVLGANNLGGFSAGLKTKIKLLEVEKIKLN